ncbi:glycosyltransferase [Bifidobacterium sp. ESL0690]|uniref:glycosyltransferase family 2 protein n=1 Tax=Bifidobacterium sp. ESL0690 TaxID=2983214 RepID=UPI0023F924E8|nr:glycosyltransferase [Bifidobacterium sp. ESL0690]WEV47070.1 glycosyltransferase [Bifidobacterium sp. ESL0690]
MLEKTEYGQMVPQVSVIVPVYNALPYFDQCLRSLKKQTLENIQVILVDDGSTDGSSHVCDYVARDDSRFSVIHQKNSGQAIARNVGIDQARADYLMFVDADDYIGVDCCRRAYESVTKESADVGVFCFRRLPESATHTLKHGPIEGVKTRDKALELMTIGDVGSNIWNKIFAKQLFQDIRFPPNRVFEDQATTCKLIEKANKVVFIDKQLYFYRDNPHSTVNLSGATWEHRAKTYHDGFIATMEFNNCLQRHGISPDQHDNSRFMAWQALLYCLFHVSQYQGKLYKQAVQMLKDTRIRRGLGFKVVCAMLIARFNSTMFVFCCLIFEKFFKKR